MIELLNCDCMDYMAKCKDKQFDLAIVDPPYGIGNFSPTGGSKGTACKGKEWSIDWNDNISEKKYFDELIRISKNRIIWGSNYFNCFENGNGAIIWHKGLCNPVFSQCEIASISKQKRVDYYFQNWQGGGSCGKKNIHPCQKPVDLYRWILKNYAKPGDKIFDSHLGSGSIAISCHDMGFDLVGCELDKEYYDAAVKRFETHKQQITFFNKE